MIKTLALSPREVRDDDGQRVLFKGYDALSLDSSLARSGRRRLAHAPELRLDMRRVTYLHHDALLFIAALVRFRRVAGFKTTFVLPESENVLHYLHGWRFPDLMGACAGDSFGRLIDSDSRGRLESSRNTYSARTRVIATPGGGDQELLSLGHFAATPIQRLSSPYRAAAIAQDSWLEQHMVSVLNKYFRREGDDLGKRIGTHVVQEAVLNAARHANATMAYTSSQFIRPHPNAEATVPRLEISVWDDGETIAGTLRSALKHRMSIKSPAFGAVQERFRVRLTRNHGKEVVHLIRSDDAELRTETPLLTAAAFLAGVSSDPGIRPQLRSRYPLYSDDDPMPVALRAQGGLGFYVIRKNVVDLFGGRIRYYSDHYRLSIERGEAPGEYEFVIRYNERDSWQLKGNLLILEVPITPLVEIDEAEREDHESAAVSEGASDE